MVISSARRLRILSSFNLISLHLHQVFELDHDRYQGLALRLRESCTVKIADAKASQHLQVIDLHAGRQEVIQTDSKPNVDSFDYLEGSRALNDHRLLNDLAELLSKLEHILSGHKCNLKHLASLTLVVGNPNVLQQRDLDVLLQLETLTVVVPLNRPLKHKQALDQVEHALKALLVLVEHDFRRSEHAENSRHNESFALANAQFAHLTEAGVPLLLHRSAVVQVREPVALHSAQVVEDLGEGELGLVGQEPSSSRQHIINEALLHRLQGVLIRILYSLLLGRVDPLGQRLSEFRLAAILATLGCRSCILLLRRLS